MLKLFKRILKSDKLPLLFTGVCTSLLLVALYLLQPGILRFLDDKIYDQQLRRQHSAKTSGVPVIVDIDEKSLAAMGQWPWPRYRVALLLEKIHRAGALAVGLDMVLAEPDRTSPVLLKRQLKRDLRVNVDFTGLPKALEDHDVLLANELRGKPYVLGFFFSFSKAEADQQGRALDCGIKPAQVSVLAAPGAPVPERTLHSALSAVCPLPILADAASATGFFNATPDPDGILRRVALLINYHGKLYPSLALATLMQAAGDANLLLKLDALGAESLRFGGSAIPVDRAGQLLVNYRGGPGMFRYVSAVDILEGKADPALLNGKIVFIGTSAAGLRDLRATPFSAAYPGVEVHAAIVDNILTQDFIAIPGYAPALELAVAILAGIAITLLVCWARAVWIVVPLAGMALGLWEGTAYLLGHQRIYISPLYAYIILAANFALLTFLKFRREEKQRRFIQGAFAHYLAPAVIAQIYEAPESLSLRGEEKEITVMFADVRDFTGLSETLSPTQVTDLLHDYLTPMTKIITQDMGTLDKFIGDAIMAFWNAPVDVPGHQEKALGSAVRMLARLKTLNADFQKKFGCAIRIGIGLHCGLVRVGNMGSADLFDYTLIGDNVNLASRLEGLTKHYGQTLIISQAMREACGDAYAYMELDAVCVKGKSKPLAIHTAMSHAEAAERAEEIAGHEAALALYRAMRFEEAGQAFARLKDLTGNATLYGLYLERCRALAEHPPGKDWDGVCTHTSK
ncbi:MAG: adenylate/guanylate cyclase domain-containing protein [Humidesulfovibrio sp.]|nr:adenylate/guanylate cyclase domain-containing protein [Humidesulfovibrio sp.]